MRDLLNLIQTLSEADNLKKTVIDLVKTTDDDKVLQKVLTTLKAGNIDDRIGAIISTDEDAKTFIKQIANTIIQIDAPVEEKDAFLNRYTKGIVNTGKLLDGKKHSFSELVGDKFAVDVFKSLAVTLVSQGVGPGEVALAVMSPKIKWSGRVAGGGDIIVNGQAVEVKTSVKSGGRWLNARKANMSIASIKEFLTDISGQETPDRVNVDTWINEYRPFIKDKTQLKKICKGIADALFNFVNNTSYARALETGNKEQIIDAQLKTGFDNYKEYSKFDGILLMDINSEQAQYFTSYEQMKGLIKIDSVYIVAPEGEIMPKVSLLGSGKAPASDEGGPSISKKGAKADSGISSEKDFAQAAANIARGTKQKQVAPKAIAEPTAGVGRKKRR
jgi:hypothetical protein